MQRLRPKLGYLLVAALSVMVIVLSYYLSTTSPQSTQNAQQLTINETIKVDALHGVVPKLSPSGKYIVRKTVEDTVDYLEIVERDGRNLVIKFKDSGRGSLYWWANHSDMLLFYENRSFDSVTPQCYAHIYSVDSGEKQSLGDCTDVIYRTGVSYSTKLNATFSHDDSRVYISDNIGSNINPKRIRQYDVTEQRYLDNIELTLPADHNIIGILPTGAAPSTLIAILKSATSGNSTNVHAY